MTFWNIFGRFAVSDKGETIQKVSETTSIASDGTTYTKMGSTTVGCDGSVFTQMGSFSTDGSTRMGSTSTGLDQRIGVIDLRQGNGYNLH